MSDFESTPSPSASDAMQQAQQHMQDVVNQLHTSLQQAHSAIEISLQHSTHLSQHLHQQQHAAPDGSEPLHQDAESAAPAADQNSLSSPLQAVRQAVMGVAEQERKLFGHIQDSARDYLQKVGQGVGEEAAATSPQDFLGQVSSALHNEEQKGESALANLQAHAQQHIHQAEQAMQHSLQSVHQAIERQRAAFEHALHPQHTSADAATQTGGETPPDAPAAE